MRTSTTGRAGVTIVELLVVVALMAVLATMALPRLAGASGAARLRASARQLLATARYARDYAVTHRVACRVVFDAEEGRYELLCQADPEGEPGKFKPLRWGIGKTLALPDAVRFEQIRIEPRTREADGEAREASYIQFDPSGETDSAAIVIAGGRQAYSLLVAPHTGRVWLTETREHNPPNDRRDLDE